MRAKHLITVLTAATAVVNGATAAAFNESCSWWMLGGQVALTGYCAADPATASTTNRNRPWAVSTLDLNRCIGVDRTANAMIWQPEGNAFRSLCSNCAMQSSEVVMQCGCASLATGGRTSSSVNLNDRVSVDAQGQLAC